MNEATQILHVNRAKVPIAAAAVVGFNAARPLFWYQSSLLTVWGGSATKLLLLQSSLLRLWADTAPKPLFEFQSSLVRLCADNCELIARSYEERVEVLSTAVEQQQFGTLLQNCPTGLSEGSENHAGPLGRNQVPSNSEEVRQDNKPVVDRMSDLAAEAVGTLSDTSVKIATDQAETAVKHAATAVEEAAGSVPEAANARQRAPRISKAHVGNKASSAKKIARKTMKSRKKPDRK
jgi:hypothetical protein